MSDIDYSAVRKYQDTQDLDADKHQLAKRNLLLPDSDKFSKNHSSKRLVNQDDSDSNQDIPRFIISILPALEVDIDGGPHNDETRTWLRDNSRGYEPSPNTQILNPHPSATQAHLNGVIYPETVDAGDIENNFRYYIEILSNGYIEFGTSSKIFRVIDETPILPLRKITGTLLTLSNFATKYYNNFGYDDIELVVSVANAKNCILAAFTDGPGPFDPGYMHEPPKNKYNQNFQISESIRDDPASKKQATKNIAQKVAYAFGITHIKLFDEDDNFIKNNFRF